MTGRGRSLATGYRDAGCGELDMEWAGRTVRLAGWVHARRDLGGLYFLQLRDRSGRIQLSVGADWTDADSLALAGKLGPEDVVAVEGVVAARPEKDRNPAMSTGEVEVHVGSIERLAASEPLPILVNSPPEEELPSEELRLRHRTLDLRRPRMLRNFEVRHQATQAVRAALGEEGFLEVETPLLTRQTPEGARDFVVPSRMHRGQFYALPQSPQLYKQLLMVAGFDRYYQIARCLRDEDLRADRQPEFTQIDVEMAFVRRDDVYGLAERMFGRIWQEVAERGVGAPWPRLPHAEALERFGTDKPDLRIEWELRDFTDALTGLGFGIFDGARDAGGRVRGFVARGGAELSRKRLEHYDRRAQEAGARGALWLKRGDDAWSGAPAKVIDDGAGARLESEFGVLPGDLVFLVAGADADTHAPLDALRREAARELGQVGEGDRWLWITDFPLFEVGDEGLPVPAQHAFTMPIDPDPERILDDPLSVIARAYDIVYNGAEFASGGIRCHIPDVQRAILKATGLTDEQIEGRFGFLLEAFRFGVPPHGGFAAGLDRIVATLVGEASIREVIAFPKTAAGRGLLEGAPSFIDPEELDALGIRTAGNGVPADG